MLLSIATNQRRGISGRWVDSDADHGKPRADCIIEQDVHQHVTINRADTRLREHAADRIGLVFRVDARQHTVRVARHRFVLHLKDVVATAMHPLNGSKHEVAKPFRQTIAWTVNRTDPGRESDHLGGMWAALQIVGIDDLRSGDSLGDTSQLSGQVGGIA